MKKYFILITLPVALYSCSGGGDKTKMLTRKWNATSVANPMMDSMIAEREVFIDTFGKNNDEATNEKIYGFKNIDSVRQALRAEWKEMREMQQQAVQNSWFEFRKDGLVIMNFSGQVDSSNWKLQKDGSLLLEQPKSRPNAATIKMDIVELTDAVLKLRYNDQGGTSTVTFKPDSK